GKEGSSSPTTVTQWPYELIVGSSATASATPPPTAAATSIALASLPATASLRLARQSLLAARIARTAYASRCTAKTTPNAIVPALWIVRASSDLCPVASRSTPVVSTTITLATSTGADSRSGSGGGPIAQYARLRA